MRSKTEGSLPNHLHLVAAARGVLPALGCLCAICGCSPYSPSDYELGSLFTDHALVHDASIGTVCEGCKAVLGGKPAKAPDSPIRMMSILVTGGELRPLSYADWPVVLRNPPDGDFVLSWATSMQRHHILRAGVSTADRMVIGSDEAPIIYRRAEHGLVLDAVEALRAWFSADDILFGTYGSTRIAEMGTGLWRRLEAVVAPHRGTPLLDLLCMAARKPEERTPEVDDMTDDELALCTILRPLVEGSQRRQRDGLAFWSGEARRRLTRCQADADLPRMVERLGKDWRCDPFAVAHTLEVLDETPGDVQARCAGLIRKQPLTVTSRLYQHQKHVRAIAQEPAA